MCGPFQFSAVSEASRRKRNCLLFSRLGDIIATGATGVTGVTDVIRLIGDVGDRHDDFVLAGVEDFDAPSRA